MVDWASTFPADAESGAPAGLAIPTGAKDANGDDITVTIDHDGNQRIGVSAESLRLDVADFLHAQGSFFFEKGPQQKVEISTNVPAGLGSGLDVISDQIEAVGGVTVGENFSSLSGWDVATTYFAATDVNAFVGIGDPDLDDPDWATNSDGLLGFALEGRSLALGS